MVGQLTAVLNPPDTAHRIEMAYGVIDLDGHVEPLHLDLSDYDRLQVDFEASDQTVNFNIVLFHTNGSRAQLGYNVGASTVPFTVDFPFTDFIPVGDFDADDISVVTLVFQAGSGNDYAVTEIRSDGP